MLDRPAFPGLLPAKPAPQAVAARPANNASPAVTNRDSSSGALKIVVAFLALMALGNLGLTMYLNQPKESVADNTVAAKLQAQQLDIQHLTDEITALKAKVGTTMNSMTRLKNDQVGLSSRVSSINSPPPVLPYSVPPVPDKTAVPAIPITGGPEK